MSEEITMVGVSPVSQERLAGRPLGEIFIAMGTLAPEDVGDALEKQYADGEELRLGEILVADDKITPDQLAKALSIQLEMPFLETINIDDVADELVQGVPISFAKQHKILPISRIGDTVVAAIVDPLDTDALDDLALLLNSRVTPVIAMSKIVSEAINKVYDRATGLAHAAVQDLQSEDEEEEDDNLDDIDLIDTADDAPIIKFVNALLRDAVKSRASDIHVECYEKRVAVRERIDGILYQKVEAPKHAQASIIARVKIMAGLNIAEKRLPQDGRIRRKIAGKDIDVRVSTIPTAHGERVVMRILDRSARPARDRDSSGSARRTSTTSKA